MSMEIEISNLGVLLGAVSSMVVGYIWYSDTLFKKQWMALAKVDGKKFEKEMPMKMAITFVMALLTSFVFAHVYEMSMHFYDYSAIATGAFTAFLLWAGISMTTTVIHDNMDSRPKKLIAITAGNRLATYLAIGILYGLVR